MSSIFSSSNKSLTIPVTPKLYAALTDRAERHSVKPWEYARRLFEAAWAARIADERGEASGDDVLDDQVRGVFLLADCEPETIAETLRLPVERVANILDGWRRMAGAIAEGTFERKAQVPPPAPIEKSGKMSRAGYTDEQVETIRALWADGKKLHEIAAVIGKSPATFSMWASKHRDVCPRRLPERAPVQADRPSEGPAGAPAGAAGETAREAENP